VAACLTNEKEGGRKMKKAASKKPAWKVDGRKLVKRADALFMKECRCCGESLLQAGIDIKEHMRIEIKPEAESRAYLAAKKNRFGHKLELV